MAQQDRLGRGLGALLGSDTDVIRTDGSSTINEISMSLISPNPNQPRKLFDQDALQSLSDSIQQMGVITPITLRKNSDGTYIIIAGERRYRAAQMAGLETIPAYIRTVDDEQLMELALIENIQRENLDAIEIALGYQRLAEEYGLTHEQISQKVSMSRANVSNYMRLLNLPAEIQLGLQSHQLEMGHARTLLSVADPEWQLNTYKRIVEKGLSVRQVEELARRYNQENKPSAKLARKPLSDEMQLVYERLRKQFGENAKFECSSRGKGQIVIPFENKEQLAQVLQQLNYNL